MKVSLDIDREQLSMMMAAMESHFPRGGQRTAATLDAAIEFSAMHWDPESNDSFDYEVVRFAPVYRQLLSYWGDEKIHTAVCYDAEGLFDFVGALRAARVGSKAPPGASHARQGKRGGAS